MTPFIVGVIALLCLYLRVFPIFALTVLAFLVYFFPLMTIGLGVIGLASYYFINKLLGDQS